MEKEKEGSPRQLLLSLCGVERELCGRAWPSARRAEICSCSTSKQTLGISAIAEIGCRELVGPLLADARHPFAEQMDSVPPPHPLHYRRIAFVADRPGGRSLQKSNNSCFPYLPRVVAALKHSTTEKYDYLLICFVARHKKGDPRGKALVSFLATSWEMPRSSIKKRSAQRATKERSMSVRLRTKQKTLPLPQQTQTTKQTAGASPPPYRESKKFCQQQTHLGRAIYAPKMEDACKNKNPRRSSSERREAGGIQGGTPWFPFFRHFFVERQRNGNKCKPRTRAKHCVRVRLRTKQKTLPRPPFLNNF